MSSRTVKVGEIQQLLAGEGHAPLSRTAIVQFVAYGMPKAARGSYDAEKCMFWYIGHRRTAELQRKVEDADGKVVSINDAQIRLTLAKAENEEMTARERRGELMALSTHQAELSKLAIALRQKLLSVPGRIASELEGLPRGEIKIALTSQLKSILAAFAGEGDDDPPPAPTPTSATRKRTRTRTPRKPRKG